MITDRRNLNGSRAALSDLRADDLVYMLAVARSGTFIAAADGLGVNHTTVARRVSALEKAVGERLLERGREGWTLTETGHRIASSASTIERALEKVADTIAGEPEPTLRGTVRVSAPDGFGTIFATHALAHLQDRHPNLRVELVTATRQLAVHASGFDLALAIGTHSAGHLLTEHLTDYALGLYASDDYLRRHGAPRDLSALRDHIVIFYIDSMLQVADLGMERHLPDLSPAFTSTNVFAHVEATRIGAGIGVLPSFLAQRSRLTRVLPREVDIHLPITLAMRKEAVTHRPTLAVRAELRQQVTRRKGELLPLPPD